MFIAIAFSCLKENRRSREEVIELWGYNEVRKSYILLSYQIRKLTMLAKLTSKNQLTLPKSITQVIGQFEYFEIKVENGQIILTPVKIQRANAVRAKLAALELTEQDITDAVTWARQP
jgi:formyltetrahydrofolate hydrolase